MNPNQYTHKLQEALQDAQSLATGRHHSELSATHLFSALLGQSDGVAPGYRGSLGWWKLELYSEGEYVFDTGHSSESFFYNWSELTLSPLEWFRLGMVTQRTRAYESDREIQRGVLVGFTYRGVDLSGYMFNPDDDKPTYVVAVTLNF